MSADAIDQQDIKSLLACGAVEDYTMVSMESMFIIEHLMDPMGDGVSYTQVPPEEVGALTSAPIISDGNNVYGYMDYQLNNFLELLAEGKTIVWQKG